MRPEGRVADQQSGTRKRGPGSQDLLVVFAVLAAVAAGAVILGLYRPDIVSNDGIQYLEGARSLARGDGFLTGVLVYDAHFAPGTLPAPQTTFPPGVSLAAVPLLTLGVPAVLAGVIVSAVAHGFTGWLLFRALGGRLGLWAALLCLFNLHCLSLSAVVVSDVIFGTFVTAALVSAAVGLERGPERGPEHGPQRGGRRWGDRKALWGAGGWLALAILCRFAGAIVLAAFAVVFAGRWLRARTRRNFLDGLAVGLPAVLVLAALFLRNQWLTGDADGGALDPFVRPWSLILNRAFWAGAVLFGAATPGSPAFPVQVAFLVLGGAGLVAMLARGRAHLGAAALAWAREPLVRLGLVLVVVYIGTLFWLSHTRNSVELLPRYLVPVLPAVLLLAGRAVRRLRSSGAVPGAVPVLAPLLLAGLVGSWSYWEPTRQIYAEGNPLRESEALLSRLAPDGRTLRQVLEATVPPDAPLLGDPGQPLGWALGRPMLAPVDEAYSARQWDAPLVHELVLRYGVGWAVQVRGHSAPQNSPLFWRDPAVRAAAPWLVPVFESPEMTLYRIPEVLAGKALSTSD